MKNNRFSFIAINESSNNRFSFSISSLLLKFIISSVTGLTMFFLYLTIKIYNQQPYDQQMAMIVNQQNNVMNILNELENKNLIQDSTLIKFNLLLDYNDYKNILPISKPVDGIITQGISLDKKNPHFGIDIATTFKNEVHATQKGMVIFSDKLNTLGNTVIIAHPNNYYSLYAHMHKTIVEVRQIVTQNQPIGYVGTASNEEGPHLHFEIWHNSLIIDPRNLIKDYKIKDVSVK